MAIDDPPCDALRRTVLLVRADGSMTPIQAILPLPPRTPPPPPPPLAPQRRASWYTSDECDDWLLANGWTRDERGNWRSPRDS